MGGSGSSLRGAPIGGQAMAIGIYQCEYIGSAPVKTDTGVDVRSRFMWAGVLCSWKIIILDFRPPLGNRRRLILTLCPRTTGLQRRRDVCVRHEAAVPARGGAALHVGHAGAKFN
jgi:hypothetical protein